MSEGNQDSNNPIETTPVVPTPVETPETVTPVTAGIPTSDPTPMQSPSPISMPPLDSTPPPAVSDQQEEQLASPRSGGSKKGLLLVGMLGIAGIVLLGVLSLSINQSTKEATTPSQAAPPVPAAKAFTLEVMGVEDGDVATTKTLKLTGTTGSKATVAIVGGTEDAIIESEGSFSSDITLNVGENQLVFTAQDDKGNQKTIERKVFYVEEAI